jgi:hypothetical protein
MWPRASAFQHVWVCQRALSLDFSLPVPHRCCKPQNLARQTNWDSSAWPGTGGGSVAAVAARPRLGGLPGPALRRGEIVSKTGRPGRISCNRALAQNGEWPSRRIFDLADGPPRTRPVLTASLCRYGQDHAPHRQDGALVPGSSSRVPAPGCLSKKSAADIQAEGEPWPPVDAQPTHLPEIHGDSHRRAGAQCRWAQFFQTMNGRRPVQYGAGSSRYCF